MVWDFCEANPLSNSSGNFVGQVAYLANAVARTPGNGVTGRITQQDAAGEISPPYGLAVATDPPYYDNVPYADISDFFYVWLRRSLGDIHKDLFRRIQTPKEEELVAFAYRHGSKDAAERFFMDGMAQALGNIYTRSTPDVPVTLFYAFKQSEIARDGLTSPGWATFLQGLAESGFLIDGTWPVRSELVGALKKKLNVLASSIVLVCRKRSDGAPVITRRQFVAKLRAELPDALAKIRAGGVGPVDMAQAAIGPGIAVFTAASKVLEPDDTPMTVRTAIALINRVRDEISGEEATSYDPETRFCIDWFESFGLESGKSGEAITMAQAYNIGIAELEEAGAFHARGGTARLLCRDELPEDWDPAKDKRLTDWECAQHLVRALESPEGGIAAAAALYSDMGSDRCYRARMLAYRLYDISERKKFAAEAQAWNTLVQEWSALETAADEHDRAGDMGVLSLESSADA